MRDGTLSRRGVLKASISPRAPRGEAKTMGDKEKGHLYLHTFTVSDFLLRSPERIKKRKKQHKKRRSGGGRE